MDKSFLPTDITFWGVQLTEHALFLSQLLTDKDLKVYAERIYDNLASLYNRNNEIFIDNKEFRDLLTELFDLKSKILDNINNGKNVGFIFKSLIEHMINEYDYFIGLIDETLSKNEELDFFLSECGQHLSLIGHLLNPTSQSDQDAIFLMTIGDNLQLAKESDKELNDDIEKLTESNTHIKPVIEMIEQNPSSSLMSKEMIEHEERETQWGVERLRYLGIIE